MTSPDCSFEVDPGTVVVEFNDAINFQSLPDLEALMTDDHRFLDSAGNLVEGRAACVAAWSGFFEAFPDYRNVFGTISEHGDQVVIRGHSECSVPELDGPALWSARVTDGKVSEWRVYEDNALNRGSLNL